MICMLTSFSSNAITAKARAIYGKRLTTTDYRELMRQRTVSDVASYLKSSTSYRYFLSGVDEMQVHRGQLEILLQRTKLEKFVSLCHYDFSSSTDFYDYTAMEIEVDVLLQAIMLLNSNSSEDLINNLPTFMQEYVSFNFLKLSKIQSFEDLLAVLRGTPYWPILKEYQAENGEINLSACEWELKTYYYRTLLGLIDKHYKGNIRKELRSSVMMEIELLNLAMIYRLKKYFKRSPEQIKRQLLPFRYKMTPKALDTLLESETDAEFAQNMRLTAYSHKMQGIPFTFVEDYTTRLSFLSNRRHMHFSTSAPIAFYSLMTLTKIEIENLINIIEGIRYGVTSGEIEKLLILE